MTSRGILLAMLAGSVLIVAPLLTGHGPRLIWNASTSVPIGLYSVSAADVVAVGDLVAILPPADLADFLDERDYLPRGVPLIKRVLALPGTKVCRIGQAVVVHDQNYGEAQLHDRAGRNLPQWQGCRVIAGGEVFLMNWGVPDSLDGRYFGPLPTTSITARVTPIWTDETGDGHFVWRAAMR